MAFLILLIFMYLIFWLFFHIFGKYDLSLCITNLISHFTNLIFYLFIYTDTGKTEKGRLNTNEIEELSKKLPIKTFDVLSKQNIFKKYGSIQNRMSKRVLIFVEVDVVKLMF